MATDPDACGNCATPLLGRWCHACGQRRLDDRDRRFGHLLGQFFAATTDLDGRFLGTLRRLLLDPARLSRDYLEGRRARWLAPVSVFLLVNVAFFFVSSISDFNLSLQEQMRMQLHSGLVEPMVERRLQQRGIELEAYAASYRAAGDDIAKSLVIWHVPWLALALLLAFADRGRYYAEHFVVALHAVAWILAIGMLIGIVVLPAAEGMLGLFVNEQPRLGRWAPMLMLGLMLAMSYRIARVVFVMPRWRAAITAPLLLAALAVAHLSYRLVQFLLTFAVT